MEIIELTKENIGQYLDGCIELQKYLVKSDESIDAKRFVDTSADSHSYFIGILSDEGHIIGMGLVSKIMDPVRIIAYINNIVVHPDTRGQGLFAMIMKTLEVKAKEWGCTRMELTCSRASVQSMYEKRGYQKKDTNYYFLKIN